MKKSIEEGLQKAISYTSYRKLISDLIASGKSSGPIQSEDLLNYSKLNDRRMTRLDKTIQLSHETLLALKKNDKPITWLVLTEGWCGDAAQTLPVINKIADEIAAANPNKHKAIKVKPCKLKIPKTRSLGIIKEIKIA